jgi:hypothetical protein
MVSTADSSPAYVGSIPARGARCETSLGRTAHKINDIDVT